VFENRTLRRVFGPTRDEVTGGWRKLRNCHVLGVNDIYDGEKENFTSLRVLPPEGSERG
jgi:hypothetical protein